MKYIYLITFCFYLNSVIGQNYFLYSEKKFQSEKITLVKITQDTVALKFYFKSSQQCACEDEIFYLTKNANGDFYSHPHEDENQFIQANIYAGKIKSILVKSSWEGPCCNLTSGIFIAKPAPPSGSTTTPKLQSLNFAPERFVNFWNSFQSKMKQTDSIIEMIDFPYVINCNFLDETQISKSQFQENGTEIYVNGNAFISNTFSASFYPNNKGLAIGKHTDGYMSEPIRSFIQQKFGDLENIYFISELPNFETETGYKAYFRESNGTFKFIGFEGIVQGD
jgi:hypothetical protein